MPKATERQKRKEKATKKAVARAIQNIKIVKTIYPSVFLSKTLFDKTKEGCNRYTQLWLANDSGRLAVSVAVETHLDRSGIYFTWDNYEFITTNLPVSMVGILGSKDFHEGVYKFLKQGDTHEYLALSTANWVMQKN